MTGNTRSDESTETLDGLEVIDKGSSAESHRPPLLFVHGGSHAAWCWDEHFLDFFAAKGYRAVAVSLRGHGASATSSAASKRSIADYVDDVRAVAESLPSRPVVIGHSLGGFVVQKYLESHDAPAGVLLASVAPRGARGFLLRSARRHPWLFLKASVTGSGLRMIDTPALAREAFFSAHTSEQDIARWAARFEEESQRAILDMTFGGLPRPRDITAPLLVLGAEHDCSITAAEVLATARVYQTEAEFVAGMGHDMLLEPGWVLVAERIHDWLEQGIRARRSPIASRGPAGVGRHADRLRRQPGPPRRKAGRFWGS